MALQPRLAYSALTVMVLVVMSVNVRAESPAPTVHWGGLAYPDQAPALAGGYTGNRFTEFDGESRRFNNVTETMGLNAVSLTWTEHWKRWPGWSTNLTVGAGPTSNQPTAYLQNEFVHDALYGIPKVPVDGVREGADFMIDGSLTRWWNVGNATRILFAGGGFSSGSLYHEVFGRLGARRVPIGRALLEPLKLAEINPINVLKGFHISAMGRYSRLWSGAAFHEVAPQSFLLQTSVSWGIYDEEHAPFFELEVGYTIDSGLFVDFKGNTLEERFWTAAMHIRHFSIETWNDQANRKDYGPTYGLRVMYDVYSLLPDRWKWR